jgi:very-short-patch-repair endonuclease
MEIEDKYITHKLECGDLEQNKDLNNNESSFRKDVYQMLSNNGFCVKTNEYNNFCLDFFVEIGKEKYIIQLDGNENFNDDVWNNRYKTKKYFKELGWNTILIRGSEFYNNPKEALKEIFKTQSENIVNKGIA